MTINHLLIYYCGSQYTCFIFGEVASLMALREGCPRTVRNGDFCQPLTA